MWTRRGFLATSAAGMLASLHTARSKPSFLAQHRWRMPTQQPFRVVENTWITMKDGVRVGARLGPPSPHCTNFSAQDPGPLPV